MYLFDCNYNNNTTMDRSEWLHDDEKEEDEEEDEVTQQQKNNDNINKKE